MYPMVRGSANDRRVEFCNFKKIGLRRVGSVVRNGAAVWIPFPSRGERAWALSLRDSKAVSGRCRLPCLQVSRRCGVHQFLEFLLLVVVSLVVHEEGHSPGARVHVGPEDLDPEFQGAAVEVVHVEAARPVVFLDDAVGGLVVQPPGWTWSQPMPWGLLSRLAVFTSILRSALLRLMTWAVLPFWNMIVPVSGILPPRFRSGGP